MENKVGLNIRRIALYLLVLFTTGYAALGVFFILCPFEQHFDNLTFIKYWQTVDGYMGKRMPIYGMTWLAVFAINIFVFFKTRRISPVFWIIVVCLGLLIADMVFTGQQQIPLNQYIQTLDFNNLTSEQMLKLQDLRDKNISNFGVRDYFQWTMFFLMSITPYLLPKLEERFLLK
jgi:hypothetical protein